MRPPATVAALQAEIDDVRREVTALSAALNCAESCETGEDFIANVRDAIAQAREVANQLQHLLIRRLK